MQDARKLGMDIRHRGRLHTQIDYAIPQAAHENQIPKVAITSNKQPLAIVGGLEYRFIMRLGHAKVSRKYDVVTAFA